MTQPKTNQVAYPTLKGHVVVNRVGLGCVILILILILGYTSRHSCLGYFRWSSFFSLG